MMDVRKFLFRNIGYFMLFLISCLYIAKGLFSISETGNTVAEIIGNGVLTMLVGISINSIFRQYGILYGEEDPQVIATNNLHEKVVDSITPFINMLDDFCKTENQEALKEGRRRILSRHGLKYDDIFDGFGIAKPLSYNKETGKKKIREYKRAYKKAVSYRITDLQPSVLTSEINSKNDPFDFGISKAKYQAKKGGVDVVSKIVLAVLFGYFTLKKANNLSWQETLWNALQIGIYMIFGVIQMLQSYMYIKSEDRAKVVKKTDIPQKFIIYAREKSDTQ